MINAEVRVRNPIAQQVMCEGRVFFDVLYDQMSITSIEFVAEPVVLMQRAEEFQLQ